MDEDSVAEALEPVEEGLMFLQKEMGKAETRIEKLERKLEEYRETLIEIAKTLAAWR